ncbi:MAG TPA: phage protein Gp37 [Roseateles sp.]
MSSDVITRVETHLVDTLTAAVAGTKLRVRDLPADWDDDMLRKLLTLAPCVLVSFSGGQVRQRGATRAEIDGQWVVYAVTSHPSGEQPRRRGNAQAIGAYEIVSRLIVPVLHGHQVPDVGALALTGIQDLFTGSVERQGLAVYGCSFAVPMAFEISPGQALADFATFAAQFDIPPHEPGSTHAEWLQGDESHGKPDAKDTVTLPTS